MSPPEGGRNIHVTSLRRSSEALAIDQCLGLITPAVLVVQSSQLCPGQRIECLAAIGAAVPRPPMGLTPGTHVVPPTMGTSQAGDTATHGLRGQNFIRRGIDGLCDRDGGRVLGHANRSTAGAPAVRRCNRIIRLNQRQFPKRLIPLSRVQLLHSGESRQANLALVAARSIRDAIEVGKLLFSGSIYATERPERSSIIR